MTVNTQCISLIRLLFGRQPTNQWESLFPSLESGLLVTYFDQKNMAKVTLYKFLKFLCSSLWNPLAPGAEAPLEDYMKRGAQASQLSRLAS